MSATQFFPIPPEMLALACETVTRKVSRLPFLRSGVMVTGELIGVTLESLNAEPAKTLALTTPRDAPSGIADGLDRCLEERLKVPGKTTVPVIVDVLTSAGIAEPAEIRERQYPYPRKAVRLAPAWTWHIASTLSPQARLAGSGADDTSALSWLSICPVCRTGILNKVVGKQLFGIPHTDFIIECTHCGAKFIPVGTGYRLVSIATIRDPLWKKYLDKTYPAETWAGLARGTSPGGNPLHRPAEKKVSAPGQILPSGSLTRLKDGSLVVPFEGKTLYFKPVTLNFSGSIRGDAFARIQKTLAEILENPAFAHLRDTVNVKYSRYLPMKAGLFLSQLKERHDPVYREFLNDYGDEKYGTFRVGESGEIGKPGVLIIVVKRGVYHAESCRDSFRATANDLFGRILPEDCLLNGNATRCRINAVLCNNKQDAGIFIHASDNERDRDHLAKVLNGQGPDGESQENPVLVP